MQGLVHSLEPFGTVDGPGIRMVVFLSGCPMHCQFCHNPEVAWSGQGQLYSPEDVMANYITYQWFYRNGGVTFSGGEPLVQSEFVYACAQLLKQHTIDGQTVHVAVDTSLSHFDQWTKALVSLVDLWMVSIKAMSMDLHKQLTGFDNKLILERIRWLSAQQVNLRIRYVVIPGYTNTPTELTLLVQFLRSLPVIPQVEVLPYHTLGVRKWDKLQREYPLRHVPDASNKDVAEVKQWLSRGLTPINIL